MKSKIICYAVVLNLLFAFIPCRIGHAQAELPPEAVRSVAWSPDGELIAIGRENGTVQLLDPEFNETVALPDSGAAPMLSLAWSPDSSLLASGSADHLIRIWDTDSRTLEISMQKHDGKIDDLAWSPDGSELADVSSEHHSILIWNPDTSDILRILPSAAASNVAWNAQGDSLAVAIAGRNIVVWDSGKTGIPQSPLQGIKGHSNIVTSVSWSWSNDFIASASADNTVKTWDITRPDPLRHTFIGHTDWIKVVAWQPGGNLLASAGVDGTILIWDDSAGGLAHVVNVGDPIYALDWNPDGSELVYGTTNGVVNFVRVADFSTSTLTDPNWTRAIAWSPDGSQIALAMQSGRLEILDGQGNLISVLQDTGTSIMDLAWSPDGRQLVTGGWDGVKLWDTEMRQLVSVLGVHRNWVHSVRWSPDGTRIASSAFESHPVGVIVWDANTGEQLFSIPDGDSVSVAWNSDGSILAVGVVGTIQLWSSATGQLIREIETAGAFEASLDWSSDDTLLLAAEARPDDGVLRIWDIQSGTLVRELVGHTDVVTSAQWSPDSKYIVSTGLDKTLRIWDTATGECLKVILDSDNLYAVDWNPDGSELVYGATNGVVNFVRISEFSPSASD